jgi:hypothetical protein
LQLLQHYATDPQGNAHLVSSALTSIDHRRTRGMLWRGSDRLVCSVIRELHGGAGRLDATSARHSRSGQE